jgi:thiol:disulfide interchange protein DsbD
MGLLLIVIGTFTSLITSLPKSGEWMLAIKKFFGILLVGASIYFLRPVVPNFVVGILSGTGLIALGSYISLILTESLIHNLLRRTFGILFITIGVIIFGISFLSSGIFKILDIPLPLYEGKKAPSSGVVWMDDEKEAFKIAEREGKVVIIDFWAEWCVACLKLDAKTFSDPHVKGYIHERFVPLKIDATRDRKEIREILSRYEVKGLPTILFATPERKILERFTITGFLPPSDFLSHLRKIAFNEEGR